VRSQGYPIPDLGVKIDAIYLRAIRVTNRDFSGFNLPFEVVEMNTLLGL